MYLILGIGVTNKAVIKKLKELKKEMIVATNANEVETAIEYHHSVITYEMIKYLNLDKIEYVVKSPGIPYYNKYVKYLKSHHVKIINEIELTYLLTKKVGIYIGVSGSVGKSSVVSLLYHLISAKYDNVILAGNIGIPLITYLDKIDRKTIIILELSSFQLDDFTKMHLQIALLLNIYDNHLDFYKSKETYYLSKFKLTNNQTKKDYFLVNLDNQIVKKYLLNHCFKSSLIDYKSGFMIKDNYLYYYNMKLINLDNYSLLGEHNLTNLKAVVTIMGILNIEIDNHVLAGFLPLKYHLELNKYKGIRIVNDSKSTCTSSLKGAIETFKKEKIILLFGGYNKNLDFSFLNNYTFKCLICFGSLANEINEKIKVNKKFKTLKEAVNYALVKASENDLILFSPGCASYDEFDSYLKRGEAFDKYVKEYYDN